MIIVSTSKYFFCMLVCCLFLGDVSTNKIQATVGQDVTLNCAYDAAYYGRLSVCWGRGPIPNSGCANEVIRTDGTTVTSRLSERYRLTGNLGRGDVSLTIMQVLQSDSGIYGCRVDIPGWFNDHKHQLSLTVVAAPPHPVRVELREVKERTITARWTHGPDTGSPVTAYRIDFKNQMASWDTAVTTAGISPTLTQVTLVDMRPNNAYNIRMFAINGVGMSKDSNTLTVTTKEAAPEGPPLDVKLKALTSRSIQLSWKPPRIDLRNGVLQGYSISYREYDPVGRQFKRWHYLIVPATKDLESAVLSNLKPATKYGVLIQAKTNAGIGPGFSLPHYTTLDEVRTTSTAGSTLATTTPWEQSTTTFMPVPPDPPLLELLEVNDNKVSLCWTAGFDGGHSITSYDLQYKIVNASWDSTERFGNYSPTTNMTTVIEVHPSTYNIRMFARNSVGSSEASNVLTFVIAETGQKTSPISTVIPVGTQATLAVKGGHGGYHAAVVVPVLLVLVAIAALAVTWKRFRMKAGPGRTWLTNGSQQLRNSELIPEL